MEDEEIWLKGIIEMYREKLAKEKFELYDSTGYSVSEQVPTSDQSLKSPTKVPDVKLRRVPESSGADQYGLPGALFAGKSGQDIAEKRKKQEEYRRVLDQQRIEQQQRRAKEKEQLGTTFGLVPNQSSDVCRPARSASPPIRTHYQSRGPAVAPRLPSAANQPLSDLSELRRQYSNR